MSLLSPPLDPRAYALRPVRILEKKNEFRFYDGTTFPENPFQGCELCLRRCAAFGYITTEPTNLIIDVLDNTGDIIQEYNITPKGFRYLRRVLKFKTVTIIDKVL